MQITVNTSGTTVVRVNTTEEKSLAKARGLLSHMGRYNVRAQAASQAVDNLLEDISGGVLTVRDAGEESGKEEGAS